MSITLERLHFQRQYSRSLRSLPIASDPLGAGNLWLKSWVYVIRDVGWWALARLLLREMCLFFLPACVGSQTGCQGNHLTSLGLMVTLPWHNSLSPLNALNRALSWLQGVRATEHWWHSPFVIFVSQRQKEPLRIET